MILQATFEAQRQFYETMRWFAPIIIVIFLFYAMVPLVKYFKRKSKVALYFSLSNFSYVLAMVSNYLGILDNLEHEAKTVFYFYTVMMMNVFILLNAVFLYLFYAEIQAPPKKRKTIMLVVGFLIIGFFFLPQNGWADTTTEGFKLMYISFMLMTIYAFVVYIIMARQFSYLSKRTEEGMSMKDKSMKRAFDAITIGALLMIVFFILMMVRVGVDVFLLQIGSFLILIIALGAFFVGFVQPSFSKAH